MKKLAAGLLALLMTLTLTLATAETYSAGSYYTIDYPDTLTLDTATDDEENTQDYQWLFMLYNDQLTIEATLAKADGYDSVSLYEATEDERDAYVQDTLDAYADDNIAFVEELTTVSGFPFYIYTMEDDDGTYYFAETIARGVSVNFYAYYEADNAAPDEALLTTLAEMLTTLRPVDDATTTTDSANTASAPSVQNAPGASGAADATSGATTKN